MVMVSHYLSEESDLGGDGCPLLKAGRVTWEAMVVHYLMQGEGFAF